VRWFGCEEDLLHELPDAPLPGAIASGPALFFIAEKAKIGLIREKVTLKYL